MLDQPTQTNFFEAFERLNAPVPWTTEEVDRLFHLRLRLGWDWSAVALDLGRTESGVKSKFKAVVFARSTATAIRVADRDPIPDSVLNEQARRLCAVARDLTGLVMGDPPRGFSELDKRSVA